MIMLWMVATASAQYSKTQKYTAITGDRVLTRIDDSGNYQIICGHTTDDHSFFIVSNSTTSKTFYTTPHHGSIVPLGADYGYIVHDMQMFGTEVWCCGTYWHETGNMVYTIFGTSYPEKEYKGFVGHFSASNIALGTGAVNMAPIDSTYEFNKMAILAGRVAAVGNKEEWGGTCLLDLLYYTNSPSYNAKLYTPTSGSHGDEVFMDIVTENSKFVTLSRFDNPSHFVFYRYRFGLRYLPQNSYDWSGSTLYCYDMYDAISNNASFTSVGPITLSASSMGSVAVSYVGTYNAPDPNSLKGHAITCIVGSEGAATIRTSISTDTKRYRAIKEAKYGKPYSGNNDLVLLLEDSAGNSALRFPMLTGSGLYTRPTYETPSPKVTSIAPQKGSAYNINLYGAGYFPSDNRIAKLQENNMYYQTGRCWTYSSGKSEADISPDCRYIDNYHIESGSYTSGAFSQFKAAVSTTPYYTQCTNGTQN